MLYQHVVHMVTPNMYIHVQCSKSMLFHVVSIYMMHVNYDMLYFNILPYTGP